jgi:predicted Kef-type K+ transport protein
MRLNYHWRETALVPFSAALITAALTAAVIAGKLDVSALIAWLAGAVLPNPVERQ